MKKWHYVVIGLAAVVLIYLIWSIVGSRQTVAPTVNNANSAVIQNTNAEINANQNVNANPLTDISLFTTADLPDRNGAFEFTANLPTNWIAEYLAASQSINFYDPQASGSSDLEKSSIFVSFYEADNFNLPTELTARQDTTIDDQTAVTYEAAASLPPDSTDRPSWLASTHRNLEIKTTAQGRGVIYIFSAAPNLDAAEWEAVTTSIKILTAE